MRNNNSKAIQRLLAMRQFPGLADADLIELAALADNVIETFIPAGTTVALASKLDAIHLVVDGALESSQTGRRWSPRQAFGALEALAGRPAPGAVTATTDTRTLQLLTADFMELLEDNWTILSSARRAIARELLRVSPSPVRGPVDGLVPPSLVHEVVGPHALNLVERLILLRQHPAFQTAKIQPLAALAQGAEEMRLPPGMLVQEVGEAATGTLLVLDGALRVSQAGQRDHLASSGTELGLFETLAEIPYAATIECITPVRALRIPSGALFDVMEDHTDFALALLGRIAGALLDASELAPAVQYELAN